MQPGAPKPSPVEVVYFPKKGKRTTSRITQTIPAVAGPIDEPVTEWEMPAVADPSADDGASRKARPGHSVITLSDERSVSDVEEGLSDLAALGHELFTHGRVHEARAIYEGLVSQSPDEAFVHTMLGTISLALEDHSRALEMFEKALKLDPTDLAARVYRGELRLTKRKKQNAIADFEAAIAQGPDDDAFVERARRLLEVARKGPKR